MLPKTHIILGFIISILLWLVFPHQIGIFGAAIIFLSSFLIDFDHYLYYALNKKDLSLKRAYAWFIEKDKFLRKLSPKESAKYQRVIMIFHGVECWILLALLIFISKIFLFVLIGILIHMVLDFIDIYLWKEPFHTKLSPLYVHRKNRGKTPLH